MMAAASDFFEGETLLKSIKPHPLAFYDMYAVWVWVIAVSLAFILYSGEVTGLLGDPLLYAAEAVADYTRPKEMGLLNNIPYVVDGVATVNDYAVAAEGYLQAYTEVGLWVVVLAVSALAVSVLQINFKCVWIMAAVAAASVLLTVYLGLPADSAYTIGMAFALAGVAGVEVYRRCHTFTLTDRRIITEVSFIGHKRNELSYDKINNLILDQGLLGRFFNFGTLIPVTASGLGMGTDFAAVTVGAAGQLRQGPVVAGAVTGGRSIHTPRVRSPYGIYGVSDPQGVQRLISAHLQAHTEALYLRDMSKKLGNINQRLGKGI